jgi:glycosyltransferase involved in cell wall biosynthesis
MKVHIYKSESKDQPCAFFRAEEPARVANLAGIEVTTGEEIKTKKWIDDKTHKVFKELPIIDADVVVLQRPSRKEITDFIPKFQKQGIAVVVEIDDEISALPHGHLLMEFYKATQMNTIKACREADLVTVSTKVLAEKYAQHGRVAIIPNCVPASMLDQPHESDGRTIGWAGLMMGRSGDMEITHGGIARAMEGTNWKFLKIGEGAEETKRGFGLAEIPAETGFLSIDEYHKTISKLDIGIVPLADNKFSQAKSYLKGIQYAAAGIPFVASPTQPYTELNELGLGYLAGDKSKIWKRVLREFMMKDDFRQEVGAEYRDIVREKFTYETNAYRWISAWEQAIENRRES